jgi:proteasome assembly chaperone (PAC2) family protein
MSDPLRWLDRPDLSAPTLVLAFEGWNDAGEAASWAVRTLAVQLGAEPLAEIDPELFFDFTVRRPIVRVEDGVVEGFEWPTCRFLHATPAPDRAVVLGLAIEPHLRWRLYVEQVMALVESLGVARVVLFGSFLSDVLYSRPVAITAVASDRDLLDRHGLEATRYEGPTGVVGLLGMELRARGIETLALWAGLPHYLHVSPNPRGALALLERAVPILDLPVDLAPLAEAARECEQRMVQMVNEDPELADYVRELKRREFAQ